MIVDILGVSIEPSIADLSLTNLVGLAMLLGAVMLVLSRAIQRTSRNSSGVRPLLQPVTMRISPRSRRSSCSASGYSSDMPSRAPPTLSQSDRRRQIEGVRSHE
ncbi:hypothetical protein BH09PLA1_BH09PLA1_27050 [soil metagenome]